MPSSSTQHPAITRRLVGPRGLAFRVPQVHPPDALPEAAAASLASWVIHLPTAHPSYPFYLLSLAHLRPVAGGAAAELATPDASHEFMVLTLNPAYRPWDEAMAYRVICEGHRITEPGHEPFALHPPTVGLHLRSLSDRQALALVEPAVEALLCGTVPEWVSSTDNSGVWP